MSTDLIWQITRDNSSFLVKRNGIQLSRERGNVLNRNSFKFSGVSARKFVDISAAEKGVKVTLAKSKVPAAKPASSVYSTTISGPTRVAAKSIKQLIAAYRPDLVPAALARVSRIVDSQKTPKALRVKKVRGAKSKKAI